MKKFCIFSIALIFALFAASCGGSSKKEDKAETNDSVDSASDGELNDEDIPDSATENDGDITDSTVENDENQSEGDDGDSGDSDSSDSDTDISDSDTEPIPDDMTEAELREACQNKETVNDVTYDCSVKACQRFTFCDFGGATGENSIAACRDGIDSDGDGYADCLDPECQNYRFCNIDDNPDKECLELIDSEGADAACSNDICAGFSGCENGGTGICSLNGDPYKYEKDGCECGYSASDMVSDGCMFNIDNNNILNFVSERDFPKKVILKTNIALGSKSNWTGLNGKSEYVSGYLDTEWKSGYFDGNGKKIRGDLVCNNRWCGLFGRVNTSKFRNLKLELTIKGFADVGGIAGYATGSYFSNIKSSAKVYSDNTTSGSNERYAAVAGGIVGNVEGGSFENIELSGSVSAETKAASSMALSGGIAGFVRPDSPVLDMPGEPTSMKNIKSSATVTSHFNGATSEKIRIRSCAGGIAGFLLAAAAIDEVKITSPVTASSAVNLSVTGAGGVVGCTSDVKYSENSEEYVLNQANNIYTADITSEKDGAIQNARTFGSISVSNTTLGSDKTKHVEAAGGIVGFANPASMHEVTVTGAYSESALNCESSSGTVAKCAVGGILGYGKKSVMLRSVSFKGGITISGGADSAAGGVIGYAEENVKLSNAGAGGKITVKEGSNTKINSFAGGIIGYAEKDTNIINTYNNLEISTQLSSETAKCSAGAIMGYGGSNTKLFESYWNPATNSERVGTSAGVQVDASCLKYDDSNDHIIETIAADNSPKLFDRLRYNIGVVSVGGTPSPNLQKATDYRTWTTYTDSQGISWPVIDLDSSMRLSGGMN